MSGSKFIVALDLETTGLDTQRDQILQVGMVTHNIETGEENRFERLVQHDRYFGDACALSMNATLLRNIADGGGTPVKDLHYAMRRFLSNAVPGDIRQIHPVGFNVGWFDIAFLKALGINLFHRRCIELGTLLMAPLGSPVPVSSRQYMEQVLGEPDLPHTALADAEIALDAYKYAMAWHARQGQHVEASGMVKKGPCAFVYDPK